MRKHWAAFAAISIVLLLLLSAPSAWGHGGNPNYRSVIDRVTPKVPGRQLRSPLLRQLHAAARPARPRSRDLRLRGRALRADPEGRHRPGQRTLAGLLPQRHPLRDHRSAADRRRRRRRRNGRRSTTPAPSSGTTTGCTTARKPRRPRSRTRARKRRSSTTKSRCGSTAGKARSDGTLYWVGGANTSKLPFIVVGIVILLGGGALVLFLRRRRGTRRATTRDDAKPAKEAW